ncbi:13319_t:CDS:2 [Entrophospora sp. SA101]|nr:8191_t:CDS:2 [Entrophospora sp. SA101]CAJ0839991.1 12815_t:CDS:2 [Entrophospora sp. SA101]CAJ0862128.1 13319_t:CDS:2 [Entrophospora sp. SA101]
MYLDKQEFMMEDNVDNMVIGMGIEEMSEEEKLLQKLIMKKNAKSESSYIVFILLADVERMKYIIQKYTMIQLSKVEKQLELILNMPVYLQDCQTQNQYLLTNDINDLDNDETEVVEEENNQDIDLLSSQLDLQKTIFCCAIRMVHESQLPKSDGENYFLDRMSPNEIYLLRYSEIKQLLLEGYVELI